MKRKSLARRLPGLFFAAVLLFSLCLPCGAAANPAASVPAHSLEEELDELLAPLLEEHRITDTNFSLGYCDLTTGETYYINPDVWVYSASLFKVPLCMVIAEKVHDGELNPDKSFKGYGIAQGEQACLVASNNKVAASWLSGLGSRRSAYELMAAYCGMAPEELPDSYYSSCYSSPFMLQTLRTLYSDSERFPHILEYLQKAQPGNYFDTNLQGAYTIAQKYGQWKGLLHTAGIIYTPHPFILVVLTDRASDPRTLIEDLGELMAEYTVSRYGDAPPAEIEK